MVKLLSDKEQNPNKRLENVLKNIDNVYDRGQKICVLRALTMDNNLELFGNQLKNIMSNWIIRFNNLGISSGLSEKKAINKAEQNLIFVQRSLIVSKAMSRLEPYQKTLISINKMYKTV